MSKSINVEITTKEQRDELVKQLQEMSFDREVKSWDDYLDTIESGIKKTGIATKASYHADLLGEEYKALYKLHHLKNYYNDGWTPDLDDGSYKFVINIRYNKIFATSSMMFNFFLAFPTEKIRDKFLENHRDLIEQAKPLL